MQNNKQSIQNAALRYLAQREHTQHQLKQKLTRKFPDQLERIEEIIAQLSQRNHQNDGRYIEALIRSRVNKGYGPIYIQQSLQQAKIPSEDIQNALENAEIDWLELAKQVYQKKYRGTKPDSANEKAKRMRFLQSRGFNYEITQKALSLL